MSKVMLDIQQGPEQELLLRCSCGFEHFLSLSRWEFHDGSAYDLSIIEVWRRPHGLIGRLGAAWRLFWRGEYHSADVQLNRSMLTRIRDWCDHALAAITTG